jgi:hypothetical protein
MAAAATRRRQGGEFATACIEKALEKELQFVYVFEKYNVLLESCLSFEVSGVAVCQWRR